MRDLSKPVPQSTNFGTHLAAESEALGKTASHAVTVGRGAPDALGKKLEQAWRGLETTIVDFSQAIHADPETAYDEHRAVARIASILTEHGIESEVGPYGVPTALRAVLDFGTEGLPFEGDNRPPTVAILSEYDALPGLGHACGHNIIAAAGLGAFLSLAQLLRQLPPTDPAAFTGRVIYLGTPAEEGGTGKERMARAGAFAPGTLDAAIMVHGYSHDLVDQIWLGCRLLEVEYTGISSHASSQPFQGRNALDAATLAYQGIGLLRQQMPPINRIHAIISEGGKKASIIPERAELKLYIRSKYADTLRDLCANVTEIMQGAALMTGCGVQLKWDYDLPVLPVRSNKALTSRWLQAQQRRGRDPLPAGVISETIAASTDFGNVSFRVPGIHPLIKVSPENVALHTREFEKASATAVGDAAAVDGAYGLAAVALDILTDSELRQAVKTEFEASGGALDVENFFN